MRAGSTPTWRTTCSSASRPTRPTSPRAGIRGQEILRLIQLGVVPFGTAILNLSAIDDAELGTPDLRLSGLVDRVNLQRAVEQLPPGYRSTFLLHDIGGYEHNEIAGMLECSIGNSKSQLHKARMKLRDLLKSGQRKEAVL